MTLSFKRLRLTAVGQTGHSPNNKKSEPASTGSRRSVSRCWNPGFATLLRSVTDTSISPIAPSRVHLARVFPALFTTLCPYGQHACWLAAVRQLLAVLLSSSSLCLMDSSLTDKHTKRSIWMNVHCLQQHVTEHPTLSQPQREHSEFPEALRHACARFPCFPNLK